MRLPRQTKALLILTKTYRNIAFSGLVLNFSGVWAVAIDVDREVVSRSGEEERQGRCAFSSD